MFIECRHILPSGLKCKAPALRNRPFCYFHSGLRRFSSGAASVEKEPLILPSLEDLNGIQIALMEVLAAFSHTRIDRRQAGMYLYGLQIATQIAMKTSTHENPSAVRSITCDELGEDLAEEATTCEPPRDCLQCSSRDTCRIFEKYEDEVEELEQQLAEEEEEDEDNDDDSGDDDEEEDDSDEEQDNEDESEGYMDEAEIHRQFMQALRRREKERASRQAAASSSSTVHAHREDTKCQGTTSVVP